MKTRATTPWQRARLGVIVGATCLCSFACAGTRPTQKSGRNAPPPPSSSAFDASALDSAAAATPALSPALPRRTARNVKQLASSTDAWMKVFAVGSDLIRVRVERDRYFVARLANDAWVDEEKLSRGLPPVRRRAGDINGENGMHVCSGVGAVFGKLSERRLWLAENAGGAMICGSSFGEFTIWRWDGNSWSRDVVHSPRVGAMAGGIFATWPIAPDVLGFGVSNLVGDTLQQPVDAMWTSTKDPWATRLPLTTEGRYVLSTCADSSGVIRTFSVGDAKFTVSVSGPPTAAKPSAPRTIPPGHHPDGPCAVRSQQVIVIEKPEPPATEEALLTFDEPATAWRRSATPWPPLETRSFSWTASHLVAVANDKAGGSHLFAAAAPHTEWSELVGWGDAPRNAEIILTTGDEIVLGFNDKTGAHVMRFGL